MKPLRLGGWARIGIVLSLSWVMMVSSLYLYGLVGSGSFMAATFFDYYKWEENKERTKLERERMKKDPLLEYMFPEKYVPVKMSFSPTGYFLLIILPVIIFWIIIGIGRWTIYWIMLGFRSP